MAAIALPRIEPGKVSVLVTRTEEEWRHLRDLAIDVLAGKQPFNGGDIELLAEIVVEYERGARDMKRAYEQITELQEKLNEELKKDRASRGITG